MKWSIFPSTVSIKEKALSISPRSELLHFKVKRVATASIRIFCYPLIIAFSIMDYKCESGSVILIQIFLLFEGYLDV